MRITPAAVSTSKRWFALPVQSQITRLAPSSNEPLLSRQKRGSWRLRISPVVGSWLHFCQLAPEHVHCATLVPGATVRLRSNGAVATVLEPPRNGEVPLRIGAIRLKVPLTDLAPADKKAGATRSPRPPQRALPSPGLPDRARRTSDNTLDLRGTRVEDAAGLLDAFVELDLAGMAAPLE